MRRLWEGLRDALTAYVLAPTEAWQQLFPTIEPPPQEGFTAREPEADPGTYGSCPGHSGRCRS